MITYIIQIPNIKTYIALFLVLFLFWCISIFTKQRLIYQISTWLFFILYGLVFALIFLFPAAHRLGSAELNPLKYLQLIPLHTILNSSVLQLIGNVIMTIPIPIMLFLVKKIPVKKICFLSIIIGAAIEPAQLLINFMIQYPNFVIDIDDLILAESGVLIGMVIVFIIQKTKLSLLLDGLR